MGTPIQLNAPQTDLVTATAQAVPEEHYRFALHPGLRQLRNVHSVAKRVGLPDPFFRVHEGASSSHTVVGGRQLINYSGYNYLDLCGDARVNEAAVAAIAHSGTSVSASRVVSGERPIHGELERAIAKLYDTPAAVVFVSGHATNVSTIGYLFGPRDLIVHDEYIHNSALTGIALSGAKRMSFAHNDWRALDTLLSQQRAQYQRVLVIIEGVYSMDGDYPDLSRFVELRNKHRVFLMVDEAHSLGVLGDRGYGLREHFGVASSDVDIWMGTLSKTLASCGGYIAGETALVEHLKLLAPGFLYSVGMSPPLAAAALAALHCMQLEPERVQALQARGRYFLKRAQEAGFDTGSSAGMAVIPVILGDSDKTIRLAAAMLERGVSVQPILYPAVPQKSTRLRFFMSCQHTEAEIDYTVEALVIEMANLALFSA